MMLSEVDGDGRGCISVEALMAMPPLVKVQKPVGMLETVQEIVIYVHRFHNLDLFKQGYTCVFNHFLFSAFQFYF